MQSTRFYIPIALWPGKERGLRRRGRAALGSHRLALRGALGLGHLEHGHPAEVATLGALGGLEVLEAVASRHAARAALETFHHEGIHVRSIGAFE